MDKIEIKRQIELYKKELIKHRELYKKINENFKRHIEDLKRQASKSNKDVSTNIKKQIFTKKDLFERNEKRFEKEGSDRIKREIEKLKNKLK